MLCHEAQRVALSERRSIWAEKPLLKFGKNLCTMSGTSLFSYLLFLIINSLQSFLPKSYWFTTWQQGHFVSFWLPWSPWHYLIHNELKPKGHCLGLNSEHPTYNFKTRIAHYATVLTMCIYYAGYEAAMCRDSDCSEASYLHSELE